MEMDSFLQVNVVEGLESALADMVVDKVVVQVGNRLVVLDNMVVGKVVSLCDMCSTVEDCNMVEDMMVIHVVGIMVQLLYYMKDNDLLVADEEVE